MSPGVFPMILLSAALLAGDNGNAPGEEWRLIGDGDWRLESLRPPVMWQRGEQGAAGALNSRVTGVGGCWRCLVEPGPGTAEAGLWFQASLDLNRGFRLSLGGNPGVGGLVLTDAAGGILWEDRYAPWVYYTPYVLEGVVERARVRVQMFLWDGETLVSQSDWLEAPEEVTQAKGVLGLHAREGVARFYRWGRWDEPLSGLVEDAPNKLRLVHGEGAEWLVVGPGNWTWTTLERRVLRQAAQVERSSAVNRGLVGSEDTWRCRVKVEAGAGGAGMLFQVNDEVDQGFIAWLGGQWGAGGLMLYRLPGEALWSSPQDRWHYDTEYLLEARIGGGKVSVRLLQADGVTVLAESPEFELKPEEIGRAGFVGFQTWKGCAEFWDFSEETQVAAMGPAVSALGADWRTIGGQWQRVEGDDGAVEQTSKEGVATALNLSLRGARGVWRCRLRPGEGARGAGLVFQASPDLKEGFVCWLAEGVRLESLDGRTLWRKDDVRWGPGREYVIEGYVETDRARVRVLEGDGERVLAESVAAWVSDRNNDRVGVLGLRADGPARFSDWSVE